MKRTIFLGTILLAAVSITFNGCGSPAKDTDQKSNPTAGTNNQQGDHDQHDEHGSHGKHDDHGNDQSQTAMEKMKTQLAKLSPEDRASAEKQHFCPVTGEMLGAMGAPQKIEVKGQQVWVCCKGCKSKLLKNPDKYLAKLNK